MDLPRRFLELVARDSRRAGIYVSASAIGYYGTSETATFDEESPPGDDFVAHVCVAWEREARRAADLGMRVAIVRTGVALGTDGGALSKILPPFRAGAGGRVGGGRQWLSWVHIDDLVGIYLMALDRIEGVRRRMRAEPGDERGVHRRPRCRTASPGEASGSHAGAARATRRGCRHLTQGTTRAAAQNRTARLSLSLSRAQRRASESTLNSSASRYFSASIAARHPAPAAVTAWRYRKSFTSPATNTPSTFVVVPSGDAT